MLLYHAFVFIYRKIIDFLKMMKLLIPFEIMYGLCILTDIGFYLLYKMEIWFIQVYYLLVSKSMCRKKKKVRINVPDVKKKAGKL